MNYVEGKGMNKIKRTLISMIVFLFVFCLSVIIDIPSPFATIRSETSETVTDSEVEGDTTTATTEATTEDDIEIEQFSYKTGSIVTFWDDPSLATQDTVEATDIQEDGSSADITGAITLQEPLAAIDATNALIQETPILDAESTEVPPTDVAEEQEEALYANIGISIAKEFVNIRNEASTDGQILGKLYKNSAVEIIDTSGDWYRVVSGSVKGYVKAEFIQTGIPDDELVEKYGELSILVTVDGLNVREKADTESAKLDVIYQNEIYPVLDTNKEWIRINIPDDKTAGYIKREHAELIVDFKDAVSKEEEEELLKLQADERAKKETEVKYQEGVSYSQDELRLLACLVHSEAGTQSYEGKLAVANVVLNRVNSSKYPDTIKDVIYQSGQFSVAKSGSLSKQLANYDNYSSSSQQLSIKAAKAALEGANNIGSRLYFHSYRAAVKKGYEKKNNCVKLGDHLFW
ncbi:MAG: hypothetical protein K0R46_1921 [Herbinix sp.]|nr:hypothetical protein [Herbinix sp.]